jgi:hypothetical protein
MTAYKTIITFLGEEARGLAGTFWRICWKVTLLIAVLVVGVLTGSGNASGTSLFTQMVAYMAVGLYFGVIAGAAAGLFAALWRLFGSSLVVVLLVAPALVVLVLWLFSGPITSTAVHFLDSVIASAQGEGLQRTVQAAEGMRLSCGGGAIAVLFLVLLAPFVLADIGLIFANAAVLWAFLQFAGAMGLMFAVAISAAFLFACPILILALVRRGRHRFGQKPLPAGQ